MSLRSLEQMLRSAVPHPKPAPLPPLKPLVVHVTMDPAARLPSTWRAPIGKMLSSKRIAEYQREGMYGSGLKLPPRYDSRPCCECKSLVNTRYCNFGYIPKPGVYCIPCRKVHREKFLKEKEEKRQWKEALEQRREVEYV